MALVPVDHRYVVENGRMIHYIALEDPATGRSVTNQVDEGAADPGTPDGPVDENGGANPSAPAADGNNWDQAMPLRGGNDLSAPDLNGTPGMYAPPSATSPFSLGDLSGGASPSMQQAQSQYGYGGRMNALDDPRMAQTQQQLMQGQAPAAAAAAGAPGASGATDPIGNPQDAWRSAGNAARFSPDNPVMALQQKMMDSGMNPFNDLNPFMAMVQRAAAGLAASFMINQANNPANVTGVGSQAPDANQMFSDFLGSALKGNVFATAQSGMGGLKQALDTRRAQVAGGQQPNASQINPFMSALMEMLNQNQGEGATSMLEALQNPLAPRSIQKGYQRGLQGALAGANRGFWAQTPDEHMQPGTDFMKFLMGI